MRAEDTTEAQTFYAALERLMQLAFDDQNASLKLHRKVDEASKSLLTRSEQIEAKIVRLIKTEVDRRLDAAEGDLVSRLEPVIDAAAAAKARFDDSSTQAVSRLRKAMLSVLLISSAIAIGIVVTVTFVLSSWLAIPDQLRAEKTAVVELRDAVSNLALYSQNADVRRCLYQEQWVICVKVDPKAPLTPDTEGHSFAVILPLDHNIASSNGRPPGVNKTRSEGKQSRTSTSN